ncbi:c-type cytochrome [Lysobacter antibioticus]|uniref:Cytochrome C oxidase, cbb3-type, subunit III family protein n=1 Tax=Lysobacter antibioticus TaxID=84531 RepID=A0A0S2FB13_LYSAN|nr:cytochrome c [Lysobacter antibioticus]ALN80732.1 cytochrome C oxidase, cbb3-type, subunit III family protein [Lysobacter antibioticus]
MKTIHTSMLAAAVAIGLLAVAGTVTVYSGVYNVAADDPHIPAVYALLETARARSISARASELQPPPGLDDEARIRQGAGNYAAMCAGCHLAPGSEPTELSKGLYPTPPDLTRKMVSTAEAFWVIKHGIKASGMPAWGKSMQDEYIWNMAAFLQKLPKLDRAKYETWVASSGGHSHGGGETGGHGHAPGQHDSQQESGEPAHEQAHVQQSGKGGATGAKQGMTSEDGTRHTHADGMQHLHAATVKPPEPKPPAPLRAADPHADMAMPAAKPKTDADPARDAGHGHQH